MGGLWLEIAATELPDGQVASQWIERAAKLFGDAAGGACRNLIRRHVRQRNRKDKSPEVFSCNDGDSVLCCGAIADLGIARAFRIWRAAFIQTGDGADRSHCQQRMVLLCDHRGVGGNDGAFRSPSPAASAVAGIPGRKAQSFLECAARADAPA